MKVYASTSVPTAHSVSPASWFDEAAVSPTADSIPGMAECVMCDAMIASTDADVFLCNRCFPVNPLGDDEFDMGWFNKVLDSPSTTEEAPSTPSSTDEASPPSTSSTSAPPMPSSPTPTVSRKRRHPSEEKACVNCNTTKTGMWRRDPEGKPLCNACGQHLKKFKTNRPIELSDRPIKKRMRKIKEVSSPAGSDWITTSTFTPTSFQSPIDVNMYGGNFGPTPAPYQQFPQYLPPPPMHPGWANPMPYPPLAPWEYQSQQYY